jgi:hypothetical protein
MPMPARLPGLLGQDAAMSGRAFTLAERPDLRDASQAVIDGAWPEFMTHDAIWAEHAHLLSEAFEEFQFVIVDGDDDVVAVGHAIPFVWDGDAAHLPDGIDGVLPAAAAVLAARIPPTAVSALEIVITPGRRGAGLSRVCIDTMSAITVAHGLADLVVPVRPTWKHRYPLTPLDRYARWRRSDGQLLDPWLRTHERAGARSIGVCPASMCITGTVSEWEDWTGLVFPESGTYIVPEALVPITIDRERNEGRYVEPNFWMRHTPAAASP